MPDSMLETELVVIGAGPGGYVAAIRGGQLGLDVTLVDRDAIGGTCLNYGCIPSKALIDATDLAHDARQAGHRGIQAEVTVDLPRMQQWKGRVIEQLTSGVEQLCESNQVRFISGTARFDDQDRVMVTNNELTVEIHFDNAIIATGSRPMEIPGFDFESEPVLDSRAALSIGEVPERLVVIGGGYIGMELSTVFAKLGSDVTVIEMLDDILPTYPTDLSRPVRQRADELGIEIMCGSTATDWNRQDGDIVLTTSDDETESDIRTDRILVAVGRTPVTEGLNLGSAGIDTDDRGFVSTNRRRQTSIDQIYAVGDVAGEPMLAHKASAEGIAVAETIAGQDGGFNHSVVPAVVFTDPEIATVGLSERDAREAGFSPLVGQFPFSANGRALSGDDTAGFVRVIAAGSNGSLLGAEIVGPEASELIGSFALGIEADLSLDDIARTVFPHPTLTECIGEAGHHARGHAIHTTNN